MRRYGHYANRSARSAPLARLAPLLGAFVSVALLLSACGGSGGAGGATGGQPTLACVATTSVQGIDVISTLLTCKVAGAPAGDTSFTLTYTLTDERGDKRSFDLPCQGALTQGAGECSQRYSVIVPLASGKASVVGKTEPSQRPLGPVVPQQRTAPSTPGPLSPSGDLFGANLNAKR